MINYILHAFSVFVLIKGVGFVLDSSEPMMRALGIGAVLCATYASYFFLRRAIAYSRKRAKKLAEGENMTDTDDR